LSSWFFHFNQLAIGALLNSSSRLSKSMRAVPARSAADAQTRASQSQRQIHVDLRRLSDQIGHANAQPAAFGLTGGV